MSNNINNQLTNYLIEKSLLNNSFNSYTELIKLYYNELFTFIYRITLNLESANYYLRKTFFLGWINLSKYISTNLLFEQWLELLFSYILLDEVNNKHSLKNNISIKIKDEKLFENYEIKEIIVFFLSEIKKINYKYLIRFFDKNEIKIINNNLKIIKEIFNSSLKQNCNYYNKTIEYFYFKKNGYEKELDACILKHIKRCPICSKVDLELNNIKTNFDEIILPNESSVSIDNLIYSIKEELLELKETEKYQIDLNPEVSSKKSEKLIIKKNSVGLKNLKDVLSFNLYNYKVVKILASFIIIIILIKVIITNISFSNLPWEYTLINIYNNYNEVSNKKNKLNVNEYLVTSTNQNAILEIPNVGKMYINENSKIKIISGSNDNNEIEFVYGIVKIKNENLFPRLSINFQGYKIIDKNGEFLLNATKGNDLELYLTNGSLEVRESDNSYRIPNNHLTLLTKNKVIVPVHSESNDSFKELVKNFVFNPNDYDLIEKIISNAENKNSLTLVFLINLVDNSLREKILKKIGQYITIPNEVYSSDFINQEILNSWIEEIEWQL